MFARFAFLLAVCVVSACGAPRIMPGSVTEAVVEVTPGTLAFSDWVLAGQIASRDGFKRIPYPGASNKPTSEELAELRRIDETNARFYEHLESQDVQLRAQTESVPLIENKIVQVAKARYNPPGSGSDALRVVVRPTRGAVSFRNNSLSDVSGFGSRLSPNTYTFRANVALQSISTGAIVDRKSVRINVRQGAEVNPDYLDFIASSILFAFASPTQ